MDEYNTILQQITELRELFQRNVTASSTHNKDDLLNLSQACTYTGFSKSFLYKLTAANEVTFYKPNNKTIFLKRMDLDNFLLRRKIKSNNEIAEEAENLLIKLKQKS